MSEIIQENIEQPETKPEEKVDPFVERAQAMGWRPVEEWDGAEEDFIDAKEFVRRQPLFEKIEHVTKELKNVKSAFDALKQHHTKVKEVEFKRALDQLKAAKRRALTEGETEQALMLEDKIDEINEQKAEFDQEVQSQPQIQDTPNPAFIDWTKQNTWYQKDRAMTAYADQLGVELHKQGLSPDEVLRRVTREVKEEFKHKFTNPKREGASAVEGGARKGSRSAGDDTGGMPEEDVRMMNKIVRSGAMTKEEYLKEYRSLK